MSSKSQVAKAIVQYFTEHSKPGSTLSPMYQRILGTVAAQVEANKLDWLVEASSKRTALETSLLLTAGMHRQVLLGEAQPLNDFYPNVGGSRGFTDPDFESVFLNVMEDCKDKLIPIIRDETVQTNETQRGLFWLFPVIVTGWEKIHLVDLGASAGLNLVADQRRFTFDDGTAKVSFGLADTNQFVSSVTPSVPDCITEASSIPTVVSRNGCDLHPFPLETEADRAKLESFMWPDQGRRFDRLHEAVEAHQRVTSETQTKICIQQANLPHDLPAFLDSLDFKDDNNLPVIIYNTYMTTYLEEQGRAMRGYIDQWAASQNRKVMWVQSEPNEESPIKHHWCAWTVDLWDGKNEYHHWQLSWVHPHGTEIEFLQGLDEFASFFKK